MWGERHVTPTIQHLHYPDLLSWGFRTVASPNSFITSSSLSAKSCCEPSKNLYFAFTSMDDLAPNLRWNWELCELAWSIDVVKSLGPQNLERRELFDSCPGYVKGCYGLYRVQSGWNCIHYCMILSQTQLSVQLAGPLTPPEPVSQKTTVWTPEIKSLTHQ